MEILLMYKEKIKLRDELNSYKFAYDVMQKIPCSKAENKQYQQILKEGGILPDGVYAYDEFGVASTTEFYTVYETDLSQREILEYLTYKKLDFIRTIKNCIVFFTVLTLISLIISLFIAMAF